MGCPTKIHLISRDKGEQWYVNFPNALAEAMDFTKGETVEWTVVSTTCLQMKRRMDHVDVGHQSPKDAPPDRL